MGHRWCGRWAFPAHRLVPRPSRRSAGAGSGSSWQPRSGRGRRGRGRRGRPRSPAALRVCPSPGPHLRPAGGRGHAPRHSRGPGVAVPRGAGRTGVTRDAWRTPRQRAPQRLPAEGDDGLGGTDTQPPLWAEMPTVVAPAPRAGAPRTSAATLALRHSHSAPRPLQPRTVRGGERNWPGLAQVFQGARQSMPQKTGADRAEGVAGRPRLPPKRAEAGRVLALGRGH
jgi:hypothetical protein